MTESVEDYTSRMQEELDAERQRNQREVLWSWVLDIEGAPGARWRKRKRRLKKREK